jgi:excisionase family DNA binding protein
MTAGATRGKKKTAPPQNGSNPSSTCALLDIDDLASWLGVEPGFVRRLIAQRRIPFLKIGKYVRFDPAEIPAWIDGQRVQAETRSSHRRNFSGTSR